MDKKNEEEFSQMASDWVVKVHSNSRPATLKFPIIADVLNVIPSSEQNRSGEGLTFKMSAAIRFWRRLVRSVQANADLQVMINALFQLVFRFGHHLA